MYFLSDFKLENVGKQRTGCNITHKLKDKMNQPDLIAQMMNMKTEILKKKNPSKPNQFVLTAKPVFQGSK